MRCESRRPMRAAGVDDPFGVARYLRSAARFTSALLWLTASRASSDSAGNPSNGASEQSGATAPPTGRHFDERNFRILRSQLSERFMCRDGRDFAGNVTRTQPGNEGESLPG